ncbi:selenide, water dikinase SelD [Collinsella ihumii]|uniref:selenide, water dikinase SelD n=1 Tax=Collinsella ihumii TaxID=1720204 RepID=UPI0025AB54F3|nr:selenide, water dikinase SelD [Collinsella ihumii]MDN0055585.1 selenide, water dikinase SelD [Collinsella ihumii]
METKVKLTKLADCAGCGAKVGAGELASLFEGFPDMRDPNLLVGFDHADDAAVYRLRDDLAIVQTLDFFPPIADDPFTFGQIAAANALSDIYAMGGRPITALNIMAVPESMPKDAVREILRGGATKVAEAGAIVAGGHSIYDDEPKYGLSVTGVIDPAKLLRNDTAQVGDVLIYTKPVGIGVLTTALKGGLAGEDERELVERVMSTLNRAAAETARPYRVHACTDITGFAVLGHTLELAQGSDTQIVLDSTAFEFLPGVLDYAAMGVLPAGVYRNRRYAEAEVSVADSVPLAVADVLFDPQTSGGLLFSVHPDDADALEAALKAASPAVPAVQRIGAVGAYEGSSRVIVR